MGHGGPGVAPVDALRTGAGGMMKPIYLFLAGSSMPLDAVLEAGRRGIAATVCQRSAYGRVVLRADLRDYDKILAWWVAGGLQRTAGSEMG